MVTSQQASGPTPSQGPWVSTMFATSTSCTTSDPTISHSSSSICDCAWAVPPRPEGRCQRSDCRHADPLALLQVPVDPRRAVCGRRVDSRIGMARRRSSPRSPAAGEFAPPAAARSTSLSATITPRYPHSRAIASRIPPPRHPKGSRATPAPRDGLPRSTAAR